MHARLEDDGGYATAHICLNGHVENPIDDILGRKSGDFWQRCGKQVLSGCPACDTAIRGAYFTSFDGDINTEDYELPCYCSGCGNAFPWTATIMRAAEEYAAMSLSDSDNLAFQQNIGDVVQHTPRSSVAALKLKSVMQRAGPAVAGMFRDILVDVLSEAVKKTVFHG